MVCVFLSFMLGEQRVIQEFGLSLASAVFLDALVVRCLLPPALLHIVGRRTWLLPASLECLVPRLNIEAAAPPALLAFVQTAPAPSREDAGGRQRAGAAAGRAEG